MAHRLCISPTLLFFLSIRALDISFPSSLHRFFSDFSSSLGFPSLFFLKYYYLNENNPEKKIRKNQKVWHDKSTWFFPSVNNSSLNIHFLMRLRNVAWPSCPLDRNFMKVNIFDWCEFHERWECDAMKRWKHVMKCYMSWKVVVTKFLSWKLLLRKVSLIKSYWH